MPSPVAPDQRRPLPRLSPRRRLPVLIAPPAGYSRWPRPVGLDGRMRGGAGSTKPARWRALFTSAGRCRRRRLRTGRARLCWCSRVGAILYARFSALSNAAIDEHLSSIPHVSLKRDCGASELASAGHGIASCQVGPVRRVHVRLRQSLHCNRNERGVSLIHRNRRRRGIPARLPMIVAAVQAEHGRRTVCSARSTRARPVLQAFVHVGLMGLDVAEVDELTDVPQAAISICSRSTLRRRAPVLRTDLICGSSPALRAHVGPAWPCPSAVVTVAAARSRRRPHRQQDITSAP